MSQHTPGPWEVEILYPRQLIGVRSDTFDVVSTTASVAPIRKLADARLIAAAPDLLEALETMLAHYEREVGRDNVAASARAAIAKAKGENRASTR